MNAPFFFFQRLQIKKHGSFLQKSEFKWGSLVTDICLVLEWFAHHGKDEVTIQLSRVEGDKNLRHEGCPGNTLEK